MLGKLIITFFFSLVTIHAEVVELSINDKYAVCEEYFEQCIKECEKTSKEYEECVQSCDENLYKCNIRIENLFDNNEKEDSTLEVNDEETLTDINIEANEEPTNNEGEEKEKEEDILFN